MVVPHGRSVGSTRSRDRHVTNPTSGYSALFFSCTSCMGTSTSKVGETETGRGGHGKERRHGEGATKTRRGSSRTQRSDALERRGTTTTTTGTRQQRRTMTTTTREGDEDKTTTRTTASGHDARTSKERGRDEADWNGGGFRLGHVELFDCSRVVDLCRFGKFSFFPFIPFRHVPFFGNYCIVW